MSIMAGLSFEKAAAVFVSYDDITAREGEHAKRVLLTADAMRYLKHLWLHTNPPASLVSSGNYISRYFKDHGTHIFATEHEVSFKDIDYTNRSWDLIYGYAVVRPVYPNCEIHIIPPDESDELSTKEWMEFYKSVVAAYVEAMLTRPTEFRMTTTNKPAGVRARLARYQRQQYITVSLTAPVKELIAAVPRNPTAIPGYTGRHMPEYSVQPFTRTLKNGKTIPVRGHKRGDPKVPRKTIYRVVP